MKLDSRILEGKKPLTCFDLKEAEKFEGKEGYFSDRPRDFADGEIPIEKCATKGILELDERSDNCPYIDKTTCLDYPYFLPAEWVKPEEPEKKYRPFLLNEFLNRYRLGNTVYFRRIGYKEVKCAMFVEYVRGESPEENQIVLGNMRYTLAYLFKNHELSLEDIWQPFGVMEDD